jgi:hypothetical protein
MAVEPIDFSLGGLTDDRQSIHPLPLAKRTVTGFIGRTERGPVNEPVLLRNYDEYRQIFGGHTTYSFVSYAVQHYFLHGGQAAVLVRVVNRGSRATIDVPAGQDTLRLQARQPGSHEFLRVSVDYDGFGDGSTRFNLVVQRIRNLQSQLIEDQELYPSLSMSADDRRYIVDALAESALLRVVAPVPRVRPDAVRPRRPGEPVPYIKVSVPGSDGDELTDYDVIGSNREGTGLFALQRVEQLDLLCIPPAPNRDLGITTFVAAERFCGSHRCMLVWDPPWSWDSPEAALRGVRSSHFVSQNALTYFPRIRQRGDLVRFASGLPACGAIAGVLSRNDASGVWRSFSGETSVLKMPFAAVSELSVNDMTRLKRFGVNVLSRGAAGSFVVRGNVTLAGPNVLSNIWQKLDKRRLIFFILSSIAGATRFVHRQLDNRDMARKLELQMTAFLMGLFKQGALEGQTASQAFMLRLFTDPGSEAQLVLRVGVALNQPGDFFSYDFTYGPDGCTIQPAPALDAEQLVS